MLRHLPLMCGRCRTPPLEGFFVAINRIESQVAGTVWKIERQAGATVVAGETLLIIESMKMEIPVDAPTNGTLRELLVAEGETVSEGQVLAVVAS